MNNEKQILTLYIAGKTEKAVRAIENLNRYCEEHFQGIYAVRIIDLKEHPELAQREQIVAVPTLIRELPAPIRILVGDLSDKAKVLIGLSITPA